MSKQFRFQQALMITDGWIRGANLGDMDDIEAAIFFCKNCEYPLIYVNNDVPLRYAGYEQMYGAFLRRLNPNVQIISGTTDNMDKLMEVDTIFILARIHLEDDPDLYRFMTTTDLSKKRIYAQGIPFPLTKDVLEGAGCNPALAKNQPLGYNFGVVTGKTKIAYVPTPESPFVFAFGPAADAGLPNRVTCYMSDSTNRRMSKRQVRQLVGDPTISDVIIEYSLRKLAFPPPAPPAPVTRPFGIGLYVERFGTGNNTKGLLMTRGVIKPGQVVGDVNAMLESMRTDDEIDAYCAAHPGTEAFLAAYEPWLSLPGNEAERKSFRHAIVFAADTADTFIDIVQPDGSVLPPSFDNTPKALGVQNIRFKNLEGVEYVSPCFDLTTVAAVGMMVTPVDQYNKGNFNGLPEREFCSYIDIDFEDIAVGGRRSRQNKNRSRRSRRRSRRR